MEKLLENKIAIITGGSSGIGKATAELFLEEGAKVVITARGEDRLNQVVEELSTKGDIIGVVADISKVEDAKRVFEKTFDTYGDLDVMVNNAGMSDLESIMTTTDAQWDNVVATNQSGVFYFAREAAKYFTEKNKGNIVNVASTNGIRPLAGFAYSVTKYAVVGMTKAIALQTKDTDVRCNAVAPGVTATEMTTSSWDDPEAFAAVPKEVVSVTERIDNGVGLVNPEDQANAIAFLASDRAKAITGQVLAVDKGQYL